MPLLYSIITSFWDVCLFTGSFLVHGPAQQLVCKLSTIVVFLGVRGGRWTLIWSNWVCPPRVSKCLHPLPGCSILSFCPRLICASVLLFAIFSSYLACEFVETFFDPVAHLIDFGVQTWVRLLVSEVLHCGLSRDCGSCAVCLGSFLQKEQLWHTPRVFYKFGNISILMSL